jgi:glycosyltransferase involved in cell wall biosynthesis
LKLTGILLGFVKRIIHLFFCFSADYVFIHRELTPVGPPLFEWIISKIMRKRIIYDFDDAIWIPNTSVEHRFISGLKWHDKFFSICKWSYKICCCNDFLAVHAGRYNSQVTIIPTSIDTSKFTRITQEEGKSQIVIGWTGTHSTLNYLSDIIDLVGKIIEDHPNVELQIICNKKPDWDLPHMRFISWEKESEIKDLSRFDIGIMPLPESEWTKGKCGFKILQYFSMGIPAIASAVGINKEIITHGKNGYICYNKAEWMKYMNLLIKSDVLRNRLGRNGRKTVDKIYSLEANKTTFLGLFE